MRHSLPITAAMLTCALLGSPLATSTASAVPLVRAAGNSPPLVPSNLGTRPMTPCAGGLVGNATVSLYATISDPDPGNLFAQFQVAEAGSHSPIVDTTMSALNGKDATLVVPDAKMPSGSYEWRVRAKDSEGAYSAWSQTCKISIDRVRPAAPPQVTSEQFPDSSQGIPPDAGKARTPGEFEFSANGVPDVSRYVYHTDWDLTQKTISPSSPGGSARVTLTPLSKGPHSVNVYSEDPAGNRSDTTIYSFYVVGPGAPDRPGDLNGDGHVDIWTLDTAGNLLTYTGHGDGRFGPATSGGPNLRGTQITYRGDWTGDGYNDLVVRQQNAATGKYELLVYPNNGLGVAHTANWDTRLKTFDSANDHWQDAQQIVSPGDVNGDDLPDLLVKEGSSLWLYYGSQVLYLDAFSDPILVGNNGWDRVSIAAPGDTNGDGIPDLWSRDLATGKLYQHLGGNGVDGKLDPTTWATAPSTRIGSGFTAAAYPTLSSSGDVNGDGKPDLWAYTRCGTLRVWPGRSTTGGYRFGPALPR